MASQVGRAGTDRDEVLQGGEWLGAPAEARQGLPGAKFAPGRRGDPLSLCPDPGLIPI
jgi:hypothetical protein